MASLLDKRVRVLLERLELDREAKCSTLSRGQAGRLALATALGHRPEVLLLDDPTLGLDPASRRLVIGEILVSVVEEGAAVLLSTHLLAEVERSVDRLLILEEGRIALDRKVTSGSARTAAAVLMVQVAAPFLALGLALWSWLGEKTSGTARFVYARPVSGDHRFLVRFAGVWTAVAVYVGGVFLFLWVSPLRTFEAFVEIGSPYVLRSNPWVNLMWDLPAASTFVLLWILMAAGTLISIAATRPSRAMGFLTLGTLVFVGWGTVQDAADGEFSRES